MNKDKKVLVTVLVVCSLVVIACASLLLAYGALFRLGILLLPDDVDKTPVVEVPPHRPSEAPAPRVVDVPPQPPPEAPVPLADLADMSVAAAAAKLGVDVPEPDPKGPPDLAWAPGNVYYPFGEPLPGGPWVGGYWQNPKDGRAMYVQAFFSSSPPSVSTAEAYAICGLPLAGYKEYSNPNPRAAELGTVLAHDTLPGKYIDVQFIKAGSDEVMFIRVSNERGYVYFQDVLP